MSSEDRFRIVDFTEHPMVVMFDVEGSAQLVGDDSVCALHAAAALQALAGMLLAEHVTEGCRAAAEEAPGERPAEPLLPFAGSIDRDRQVWTDGTGHVWDLSVAWADVNGDTWRWRGGMDPVSGAPVLRCEQWEGAHPLDVLREGRGPIRPVVGGAA